MIASVAILIYSCLLLVEWTEGRLVGEPANNGETKDIHKKGIQSGPANHSYFKFSFENENKCNKYTFSQCEKGNLKGTDQKGYLLYSDRISQDDRENGVMACQTLCERIYDDFTYWIFRLQEQTCECWGKIQPDDYLSNCHERAWFPKPEMSEVSTDNLCHAKEDEKECSKIKFLQCQYGPDRGKPSAGIDTEDKCQANCMSDKLCKFYEWKQDDKGQYECKKHLTDNIACMWVFGPKGAPKYVECSDGKGSNESTVITTHSPDETSKGNSSEGNGGPVEPSQLLGASDGSNSNEGKYPTPTFSSSNEIESKHETGSVDGGNSAHKWNSNNQSIQYEKELKKITEKYEKEKKRIKELHKTHETTKYVTGEPSKYVTDDTSKYLKIKCTEPWCKIGASRNMSAGANADDKSSSGAQRIISITHGNDNTPKNEGDITHGNDNTPENGDDNRDDNESSKNGNDKSRSGTQRIISITHGNDNTPKNEGDITHGNDNTPENGDDNRDDNESSKNGNDKSRSGTQRIISITHGNDNTPKNEGDGDNGAKIVPAIGRKSRSGSRSTQNILSVTQPETARNKNKVDGHNNDPAMKKSTEDLDTNDTKALSHIVKFKDETERFNQKEKDQLHSLLSRMMGKRARNPRKMNSRSSTNSDLEKKDINLHLDGGHNTNIEIKKDSSAEDNADKPDDFGAKSISREGVMNMKAIDISVEGDFNITIINDENSGDSTTHENQDNTDMPPEGGIHRVTDGIGRKIN